MNKRALEQKKVDQSKWRRFVRFLMPPKKPTENIFQYLIRQLFIVDSNGRPSITVTILVYTMVLFGMVVGVACDLALKMKTITDAANKIISVEPMGFSDTFLVLMMGLTVILTGFYRQRQNKVGSEELGEKNGITSTIKQFITNKISNLSWGNSAGSTMPGNLPPTDESAVGDPKDVVGQ